jgi:osmotically-inducible protein OsmY
LFGDGQGVLGAAGLSSLFFGGTNRSLQSLGASNQFGFAGGSGRNSFNNQSRTNRRFQQHASDPRQPLVRTQLRVGFFYPAADVDVVREKLQQRFTKAQIATAGPIEVIIAGQQTAPAVTAILRGIVATEESREVAGQMAAMEPGITNVQHELRVVDSH